MNEQLIDDFKTAYWSYCLRPVRGCFFVHRKRYDWACPLVALALARGVVDREDPGIAMDDAENFVLEWAADAFGQEWVFGFLDGFDGQTRREGIMDEAEYQEGFGLGVALAQEILPLP